MGDEVFAYGAMSRQDNGIVQNVNPAEPVPSDAGTSAESKPITEDAIVVKIDEQRPRPLRSHRGHVRTGSSVEDHPPLYAKDSAYLISERSPSRQRQLLAENWKLVIVAVTLCILGVGLVVTGIIVETLSWEHVRSFVFYIAGAICLIPGVYHIVYIYFALKGKQGYNLANLPVFNWT